MKAVVLTLLQSRKFWLTLIPMVTAVVMFARHGIDANQLAQALTAGFGVLVFSIAHEDRGAPVVTAGGPTTIVAPADPTVKP